MSKKQKLILFNYSKSKLTINFNQHNNTNKGYNNINPNSYNNHNNSYKTNNSDNVKWIIWF